MNRAFSGIDDRYSDVSAHSKVNGRNQIINFRTAGAHSSAFPIVKRSGSRATTFNVDAGA
jgi:hypothetical protein